MLEITRKDKERYDLALAVAKLSECRFRMGAVIYRGSVMVSLANNVLKTHPEHKRYYRESHVVSIHAEHRAILTAQFVPLKHCTIYVARDSEGKNTSKPCMNCLLYMRMAGIRTIVYTIDGALVKERI